MHSVIRQDYHRVSGCRETGQQACQMPVHLHGGLPDLRRVRTILVTGFVDVQQMYKRERGRILNDESGNLAVNLLIVPFLSQHRSVGKPLYIQSCHIPFVHRHQRLPARASHPIENGIHTGERVARIIVCKSVTPCEDGDTPVNIVEMQI